MKNRIYHIGELDSRVNVGVVTAINPLVKYLKRLGLNIFYITSDNMPKFKYLGAYKSISNLNRYFPKIKLTTNLRNLWAIRAIQELDNEAMLHIHSFTLLPHLLQSLQIPRKVLLTYYGTHSGIIDVEGPTNPYYLRAILNVPDLIIVDETDRNVLLERAHIHIPNSERILRKKMVTFPFIGIDDEVFDPQKIEPHPWFRQNINGDGLVIYKGGAIESMKGDSLLIKIAKTILFKRKDIYFVWGGYFRKYPPKKQAILKTELKQLSEKYPKNAFYMGTYVHADLPSLLKGADVVPHFHERVSNCLSTFGREAVMMGRYMLATNIGWYRDLMNESKGLHVFEWKDDDKLIKKVTDELIYLVDNIDETRKKGLENRKYALKYCSARVSALQHKKIYEALANDDPIPTTEDLLSMVQKAGK